MCGHKLGIELHQPDEGSSLGTQRRLLSRACHRWAVRIEIPSSAAVSRAVQPASCCSLASWNLELRCVSRNASASRFWLRPWLFNLSHTDRGTSTVRTVSLLSNRYRRRLNPLLSVRVSRQRTNLALPKMPPPFNLELPKVHRYEYSRVDEQPEPQPHPLGLETPAGEEPDD